MLYEINLNLCQTYHGLDPIKLLNYPAEDVIELINQTVAYNGRKEVDKPKDTDKVIRKPAGDDWF